MYEVKIVSRDIFAVVGDDGVQISDDIVKEADAKEFCRTLNELDETENYDD